MTSSDPGNAATNGQVGVIQNSSRPDYPVRSQLQYSSSNSLKEEVIKENWDGEEPQQEAEDTPVNQIEHDLDELTFSGAAINDLEVQLMRTKELYRKTLIEGRTRVDQLAKKLNSHIMKSEPFVQMWRKAKEVQEKSNRAAARFDKANSQHAASKEMIRVAEMQLEERLKEPVPEEGTSSLSPLDAAWQEMLNHATRKVMLTEKERRDSELEHRQVLDECNQILTDYRATERKLRTHIAKSRPYYEARFRTNQQLLRLKGIIKDLEQKISKTKLKYSASLKRLDVLSTEIHMRRGTLDGTHLSRCGLDPRQVLSTGNSPVLRHNGQSSSREDTVSVDSLQMSELGYGGSTNELGGGYGGSVGSLPSLNDINAEHSDKLQKSSSASSSSSPPISLPESPTSSVPPTTLSASSPRPPSPHPPSPPIATSNSLSSSPLITVCEPSNTPPPPVTTPSSSSVTTPPLPSVSTPHASVTTTPSSSVTSPSSPPMATPTSSSVTTPQATPHPSVSTPVSSLSSTPVPSSSSSSPVVEEMVTRMVQSDSVAARVDGEQTEGSRDDLQLVEREVVATCIDTALGQNPTLDPSTSADGH